MSNSGGGAATNAGIEFQQRVSAWFAVAMLKGADIASVFELESSFVLESISWETSASIDDLLLRSQEGSVLVQVKRSLELSASAVSDFRSVLTQFVTQFLTRGEKESYALILSPLASRSLSTLLPRVLLSIRLDPAGHTSVSRSKKEAEVLATFRQGVEATFLTAANRSMTEDEFIHFCQRVRVVTMAVETHGADERSALIRLQSVPRVGAQEQLVWSLINAQCIRFATARLCCAREPLERIVFAALAPDEPPSTPSPSRPEHPVKVFLCYARADELHRAALERHLSPLIRSGRIILWHDRKIAGGAEWAPEIAHHLESADLILLLVSSSFMASNYCWDVELKRAMERHDAGEATVVPVFVENCYWKTASFARLQGFPRDAATIAAGSTEQIHAEVARELTHLIRGLNARPAGRQSRTVGFDRDLYLRSVLSRMELLEDEALFAPDTYIELEKDIAPPALEPYSEFGEEGPSAAQALPRHLKQPPRRTRRPLFQLLRERRTGRILALLGDPGAGKSVLLRRLMRDLISDAQKNPKAPLPLYLPLGSYTQVAAGAPVPVEEFLHAMLESGPAPERALAPLLSEDLAAGRLILLLDGMDEMPRTDFSARVTALREFMQRQTLCRILISCRFNDFPRGQLKVHQVRLVPLSTQQIKVFLKKRLNIPWWRSGELIRQALAPNAPLAGLAPNPLFLSLFERHWATRGNLPQSRAELFQGFMDPQLERALSQRPGLARSRLVENLGRLSLAMINCAGIGTSVPAHTVIQQAGFEDEEGAKWLDIAQLTGIVKRDVALGTLRFLHPRLQEFLAALALSQLPAMEREHWLRSNVDNPWLEEIYLLVVRREVDISSFAESILDEAETTLGDAGASMERGSHVAKEFARECRLSLLGRMLEAGRLSAEHPVVTRMAELLVRLEHSAHEHVLPELRQPRLLRAVRGPLLSHPRLEMLMEGALTSTEAWRKDAAVEVLARGAVNDAHVRRRLAFHLLGQTVRGDLFLEHKHIDIHLADKPELNNLRRLAAMASLWHLLLIFLTISGWAKVCTLADGAAQAAFSVFVSLIFYAAQFSRRRHRPTTPSALISHLLVLLFHAAAFLTWTGVNTVALGMDWLLADRGSSLTIMRHALGFADGFTAALTYSILITLLAAFSSHLVNWLNSARKAVRLGFAAGLVVCASEAIWTGLPAWTLGGMCMMGVILSWILAPSVKASSVFKASSFGQWMRRRPVLGTGVVVVVFGTVLPLLLLVAADRRKQNDVLFRLFSGEIFAAQVILISQYTLLVVQSLLWLAVVYWVLKQAILSLGRNLGAILLARAAPPGPLRLTQLSLALRLVTSPLVVLEGRKAAIRSLGEMDPPSEALVLALLEYSFRDQRVEDRPELAKAVDTLQERLRREPELSVAEKLHKELPILAVVTKAWRVSPPLCQSVCLEWMSRLGITREVLEVQAGDKRLRQDAVEVLRHLGPPEQRATNEEPGR